MKRSAMLKRMYLETGGRIDKRELDYLLTVLVEAGMKPPLRIMTKGEELNLDANDPEYYTPSWLHCRDWEDENAN